MQKAEAWDTGHSTPHNKELSWIPSLRNPRLQQIQSSGYEDGKDGGMDYKELKKF